MLTDKQYARKRKRLKKMYDRGEITLMEYFLMMSDFFTK